MFQDVIGYIKRIFLLVDFWGKPLLMDVFLNLDPCLNGFSQFYFLMKDSQYNPLEYIGIYFVTISLPLSS